MPKMKDAQIMAESIMRTHGGKAYFNFGEVSRIIGCGKNTVAAIFHKNGILVSKIGKSKRVSAYDIAEVMCTGRVAPIE
jgi:hypothetical protein